MSSRAPGLVSVGSCCACFAAPCSTALPTAQLGSSLVAAWLHTLAHKSTVHFHCRSRPLCSTPATWAARAAPRRWPQPAPWRCCCCTPLRRHGRRPPPRPPLCRQQAPSWLRHLWPACSTGSAAPLRPRCSLCWARQQAQRRHALPPLWLLLRLLRALFSCRLAWSAPCCCWHTIPALRGRAAAVPPGRQSPTSWGQRQTCLPARLLTWRPLWSAALPLAQPAPRRRSSRLQRARCERPWPWPQDRCLAR